MTTEFGKRLIAARAHAKLTQEQLRKKVGMAQSTMSAAENSGAGSRKTPQIAAACGVNAHWLATGEGSMFDPPNAAVLVREDHRPPSLDLTLELLGAALAQVPAERRDEVGDALRLWARYGGRDTYRRAVLELLREPPAASPQTGTR